MATDKTIIKISQSTVVIPEHCEYEPVRISLDSGLLKKGDKVILQIKVNDKNGVEKFNETSKVTFQDFPTNGNEVLGVVNLSFNESPVNQG